MSLAAGALALFLLTGSAGAAAPQEVAEGVAVRAEGGALVSPELVEDLRAGLAALPYGARRFPGGPLEIALHATPAPFGLGDGTGALPEWSDGGAVFDLYAYAEPADRRALFRLQKLTPAQRERLWRRRAMVHAVVERWDRLLRWSHRPAWRRVTGWLEPLDRALTFRERNLDQYAWAFSRARGRASAAEDLATFAEEAVVPPEALDPAAGAGPDAVRCQEFSKWRFLFARLAAAGPPPPSGVREPPRARGACPLFDAWADAAHLDHLEILFASPSGNAPESLFGHLLLRPVHAPGARARGPSFEPVVEIAAIASPLEGVPRYIAKGLTGGLPLVFSASPGASILSHDLEVEQRDVRRFRLNLTAGEAERALERVWELERRGYFEYYFFTDNCASMAIYLLNGALEDDRQIAWPGTLWAMPTAALDAMAEVQVETRAPDGTVTSAPLLTREPQDFASDRTLAQRAEEGRDAAVRAIAESDRALGRSWREALARMRDPKPRARLAAYGALGPLVAHTVAVHPERAPALRDLLAATLVVERYAADAADHARDAARLASLLIPPTFHIPTTAELVAARQKRFEHEDPKAGEQEDLDHLDRLMSMLETAPHRKLTKPELRAVELADATDATYRGYALLAADLADRYLPGAPPETGQADGEPLAPARGELTPIPGSGYGRFALGVGAASVAPLGARPAPGAPWLLLDGAAVSELLGEDRARGFGPLTELTAVASEVRLAPAPGWPHAERADATLLRFRTMNREIPTLRASPLSAMGWGFGVDSTWRPSRPVPGFATLDAEGLALAAAKPRLASFTALGLGAEAASEMTLVPHSLLLGPRLELLDLTHFFGEASSALRLDATWAPLWRTLGPDRGALRQQARLDATLELGAGTWRGRTGALRPRLRVEWTREAGRASTEVELSAAFELF